MKLAARVSVAALVAAGALPAMALAQQVGTVAAVNRDMAGTPPGSERRTLDLGLDVVRNERVETSTVGSGQLMFLDETTLTVSPNADIVLDEYVYDPNTGTTELALSMTKGALRFIGGRITKAGPATIRTPTATVGIRGGMNVLQIGDNGETEVIHIAGEYSSVMQCGDANGDGIDDACSPEDALSRMFLSRPGASALAQQGGGVKYMGLAGADKLAGIFGKLEGQGQGGVDRAPSDGAVDSGSGQVATVNSGVQGGENNQPVSTTGETPKSGSGQSESFTEPTTVTQKTPIVGGQPGNTPPPPTATLVPDAGAAFAQSMGFQPFTTVAGGSLIGKNANETIKFPVPDTPAGLILVHPEGAQFTPKAVSLFPNTGLFEFSPETATSTSLGPLTAEPGFAAVGLADFGNEFVFVPFGRQDVFELGIAMFGTPTPGQGQFFLEDPDITGAQTVDVYHNEFGLDLGRSFLATSFDGRIPTPEQLFLVGKSGDPRFISGLAGLDGVFGDALAIGDGGGDFGSEIGLPGFFGPAGRAVSAAFEVQDGFFGRTERLALFVEPLTANGATLGSGMNISGNGFVTLNSDGTFAFAEPAYGTFEDAERNTLFGPDGNYFVLSSVHRDRDGTLDTTDFGTDLVTLDPFAANGAFSTPSPFRGTLFTRDEELAEVVAQPLPLASQPSFFLGGPAVLDGGFAAGIAICSSGNCGGSDNFSETPDFVGGYPLFSVADPSGTSVTFDATGAGMGFQFVMLDNEFDDDDASNIGGTESDTFVFNVIDNGFDGVGDSYGAYLDDRRFAAVGNGPQLIAGNVQQGTVGLASSGMVGGAPGLFPVGVDTDPEFLRWGFWAATYQVPDGTTGQTRTDLVPAGTFVAGNQPNPADIPFSGSASYSGFAVATAANTLDATTRTIGGSFELSYDFGSQFGRFDLNLPTFAVPQVGVNVFGGEGNLYEGGIFGESPSDLQADVRGSFFAGSGDPVAATAGNFAVEQGNDVAIGVYGGTSSGLVPGEVFN